MMRYSLLNIVFLLPVVAYAWYVREKFQGKLRYLFGVLLALLALTMVFDNVVIFLHHVLYYRNHLLGVYFYKAPIEDFAYTIAAVLLVASLWKDTEDA